MKSWNKRIENGIGVFFCIVAGLCFAFLFSLCFSQDIWYDEVYSLAMSSDTVKEMILDTARDVHPPFYFLYLKMVQNLCGLLFPALSEITAAKIASLLPFLGIGIYAMILVRKRFGIFSTGIYLLLLISMPQLPIYALEIRMYSLSLFFVTAMFLHAYEVVCKKSRIHFAAVFLYGILTAYTQYFACVAVIALYVALLVYFRLQKEWRTYGKDCLFCIAASVISYIPWLPYLWNQIQKVGDSYWILPLTLRSIPGCMKFIFLPVSYDTKTSYFLAVCMILVYALFFILKWRNDQSGQMRFFLAVCVWMPAFVVIVGFICSVSGHSIFVYRYLLPTLGVLWLSVASVLGGERKRKGWGICILPFLMAAVLNLEGLKAEEYKKSVQMEKTMEMLDEFPKDACILANFDHVQAVGAFYLDNPVYLYGWETDPLIEDLFPNCLHVEDAKELRALLQKEDVYFWGSFQARENLIEEWLEDGILAEEKGTYLLERYWFNIYHLELEK